MKDQDKTKDQLIEELGLMRKRVVELEKPEIERKQREEALYEIEEMFKLFMDYSPIYVFFKDENIRSLQLSKNYEKMLGRPVHELIGKTMDKLFPTELAKSMIEDDLRILRERKPIEVEEEFEGRFYTTAKFPITREGKPPILAGFTIDITERKRVEQALSQSEERFRDLYDHAPVGGLEYEVEGRITNVNNRVLEMLGYTAEEIIGQPLWKFIAEEKIAHQQILAKLAGTVPPGTSFEMTCRRKDGTTIPVLIWDRLLLDEKRRIKGIGCMIQDITQLKHAEAEKADLLEQLHQAQKMEAIGTLAGGIAHDFNNILFAILGYAELASLDIEESSKAGYNLQQSMKAAQRAKDLVQQILSFSRQGKQERKPLDIKPLIKEGLKFLRSSLPTTIEIQQNMEESVGTIEADPTQIHQVLMNLCANAAQAMDKTGGILRVSLSKLDIDGGTSVASRGIDPGSYVRLRVSDTGHGMPPEILKRIFDPYFTTKAGGKGTGLGLAVIHGIVKSHGGGIIVSSEVGKGSTFDIYFPRIEAAYSPSETDMVKRLPLGRHERVLFVDDEGPIVEIGRNILEKLGYEVTVRTSSIEALELFRVKANRFDLVITDMTMPNMTGDELAQELLRIRPGIPIIICTGFSEHITEEKAKAIGIREFVMKPLVMGELADIIRKVMDYQKKENG